MDLSFEPLTPVSFLDRAAAAHGDRIAVVDGDLRMQLRASCTSGAGGWPGGLAPLAGGRPVAVLAPNTHVLLEANFGVPWAGVPLVAINTRLCGGRGRLHPGALRRPPVLVHDPAFDDAGRGRRVRAGRAADAGPGGGASTRSCSPEPTPQAVTPADERALLSINYTSGTTGRPKGVMYHHRGAYLQALAMVGAHRPVAVGGAPVDAADVPLQRLVLPVGGHGGRRHPRVPAEGASPARCGG